MAQVESVGHGLAGGVVVDPTRDRQLAQAQVLDLLGAVATDLDQPVLAAPDPPAVPTKLGVGGVQVGPARGQRQVPRLRRPPLDQRTLDRGQRGGGVQGVEVGERRLHAPSLLEHVFERKGFREDGDMILPKVRDGELAGRLECHWQRQLPEAIRELVLDDQALRNDICWSVFAT